MDREKVIKETEDGIAFAESRGFGGLANTMRDVLALLKEKEAVAVYESKISRCACGNTVNRYWHPKFCGYCGKELMWY